MDGQRARIAAQTLDRIPSIGRTPERRRAGSTPERQGARSSPVRTDGVPGSLTRGWAAVLGFGWPLAFMLSIAIEPSAAEPDEAIPLLVSVASLALLAGLVVTAIAAGQRHPGAAVAGVVTGLIALGFTVSCPATGHHTLGAWWYGQLALTVAMLGASVAALGRRARVSA